MFGLGYLIKKGVKSVVYTATENKELATAVGISTAFVATGGLSVIDEVIENGADVALDGMTSNFGDTGTIADNANDLRQGE